MIKCVIVEDTPLDSLELATLLSKVQPSIQVMAVTTNVEDSYSAITNLKPELVFLDVELDYGESCFELIRKFEKINFEIVITTWSMQVENIIKAINIANAIHFINKPVVESELVEVIRKFRSIQSSRITAAEVKSFTISDITGTFIINIENVVYAKSFNTSTTFFFNQEVNGKLKLTSSKSIKEWEYQLSQYGMVRIHNRFLINQRWTEGIEHKGNGGFVMMKGNVKLPLSRSRKAGIIKWLISK